jgi:hypothetical protein
MSDGIAIPESFCPMCKHRFNRSDCTTSAGALPNPGDLSVCIECGQVLVFDEHLVLVLPSLTRLMRMSPDHEHLIEKMQSLVRLHWKGARL